MKTSILTLAFVAFVTVSVSAQSESFLMLKSKFRGSENVFSFGTSGFLAKTILWAAGEREYKQVFRDVRHVQMIIIPKKSFRQKNVTLGGFKKAAKKEDRFEEVMTIHDEGDDVSLLLQAGEKNSINRYLLLVEDNSEVVAIELVGYIDQQALRESFKRPNNYKHL